MILVPRLGFPGEATRQLKTTIEEFVDILTKTLVSELQATGLSEGARRLVFKCFDFSKMTRVSSGQHRASLQVSEQAEFVAALAHRMLVT
jgi:hypothetical protein